MNKRNRVLVGILSLIMALSLAFGLSACGGSADDEAVKDEAAEKKDDTEKDDNEKSDRASKADDEDDIEQQVDATFSMLSALDEDDVRDVFGRDTCQEMESMGIDPYEFYQALFSNFDYSIDDIRVDGDETTVELTVSNVDIDEALVDFEDVLQEWAGTQEAVDIYNQGGEDALMAAGMQLFVDMLSSGEVTTFTSEITIDMERTSGGAWDFSDPDQVATALFGESQEINTDLGDVINV